jgi:hypothetical protein
MVRAIRGMDSRLRENDEKSQAGSARRERNA